MSSPFRYYLAISFFTLSTCLTLGCAATAPVSRTIFEDHHKFVRLEVTARANQLNHNHPASLSENQLANILSSFTVNPQQASSHEKTFAYMAAPRLPESSPAFSPAVTAFLAKHLSQALQRATPLEEALFFIEDSQPQGTALITSGGCYIQNGRLHFQLANYRHPTIGKTEIIEAQANPLHVLSHQGYNLIPGPNGTIQPTPMWKSLLKALPQHAIIDYGNTHKKPVKHTQPRNPPIDNNSSVHKTLTEHLRELDQAKSDGLITEEEFHTLRAKLLNSY